MKPFWVETNVENNDYQIYYYDDLVQYVNTQPTVILNFKEEDTFGFICNLVNAAVHNKDIVLFDLNFKDEEVVNLTGNSYFIEKSETNQFNKYLDLDEILKKVKESSTRLTFFTSGTTGIPKKVTHSLNNLLREVRIGENYSEHFWGFGYNPTHIAGIQLLLQGLLNQNTMINLFGRRRISINYFLDVFGVTNISATPSFFRMLMPFEKDYSLLKKITLGGEKSTPELINKIKEYFPNAKVNNVYASTEFGSLFSSCDDFFKIRESHLNFIKILDGRILVHKNLLGENIHANFLDNEWYDTGDMIEFIDESHTLFRIIGRSNELINVGGEKVNPSDVEAQLLLFEEIKECRVYGLNNSVLGKIVAADIVLYDNCIIEVVEIRKKLQSHLLNFKIPRKINIVEKLERGRTGKIARNL